MCRTENRHSLIPDHVWRSEKGKEEEVFLSLEAAVVSQVTILCTSRWPNASWVHTTTGNGEGGGWGRNGEGRKKKQDPGMQPVKRQEHVCQNYLVMLSEREKETILKENHQQFVLAKVDC